MTQSQVRKPERDVERLQQRPDVTERDRLRMDRLGCGWRGKDRSKRNDEGR